MVILLQLCIFAVFTWWRGRYLFGWHLLPMRSGSRVLVFSLRSRDGRRTALHIGLLRQQEGIPFVIRSERWYHRVLKSLGIASEIRVGNPAFDDTYFIITDFPGHLEQLLAAEELQAELHKLFLHGVSSVRATSQRLWCVIKSEHVKRPDRDFAAHPRLLRRISAATCSVPVTSLAARKLGIAALAVIAVHAGLLMLGLLGFFPTFVDSIHTVDMRGLFLMGALAGAVAAGFWLSAILVLFKGTSWVSWVLVDFVICGVLGFILSGISVVRDVNVEMPQDVARSYGQPVVQKVCELQCQKGSGKSARRSSFAFDSAADCNPQARDSIRLSRQQLDSICAASAWFEYTIRVKHWREPRTYSFSTNAKFFDAVAVKDDIRIPVHPGSMGLEWVDWDEIHPE